MFEVLYKPFPESLQTNSNAHVALVWVSKKGQRILIQGLLQSEEGKCMQREWFETTAEALNTSPTFRFTSAMLRTIEATWKRSQYEEQRRSEMSRPNRRFFGADFGRQDFSEPGRGGSGVDGIW